MSEDIRGLFARNLRSQLYSHGKKQIDLAEYMKVSTGTVSEWCSGKKMPRTNKIQAICNWLFIEMDDLLTDKPASLMKKNESEALTDIVHNTNVFSNCKKALLETVIEMSEEQAEAVLEFLNRIETYASLINKHEEEKHDKEIT